MNSITKELDLTQNPRREIGEKILSTSNALFESVKSVPLPARASFPKILKNNNFALVARITKKYAFLEVTTKLRAQRTRDSDRIKSYREFFHPQGLGLPAPINADNSRYIRFSGINIRGTHAISLGSDVSFVLVGSEKSSDKLGNPITQHFDILYVVAFGNQIREEESWQEFDALIRITLSDWSNPR